MSDTVAQYTTLAVPYIVYDPTSLTTSITLSVNGNVVSQQTVDRTQQIWSYRVDDTGDVALEIICGSAAKRNLLRNRAQAGVGAGLLGSDGAGNGTLG